MLYVGKKLIKARELTFKNILIISFIPACAFLVWIIRNSIMSGWIFYPSTVLGLNVDWRTPLDLTLKNYSDVKTWARMPLPNHETAAGKPISFWILPWIKINLASIRFWLVGIIPFVLGISSWLFLKNGKRKDYLLIFLFLWTSLSLCFWFIMAPDIRFGDGLLIVFFTVPLSFLVDKYQNNFLEKYFKLASKLTFVIFLMAIFLNLYKGKRGPVNFLTIGKHESGPVVKRTHLVGTVKLFEAWTPVSVSECKAFVGEKICPANERLFSEFSTCSNSPIPCMPYNEERLRFRNGKDLEDGVKILVED